MAVTIEFYTYGKKLNSTATPSGTPGLTAQCELRAGTDQLSPSIILNYANPVAFNYAHIEAFSRYYFINEWTWDDGLWVGSLTVDVLASWKNTIRAYSQYVTRSASRTNPDYIDPVFAIENVPNRIVVGMDVLANPITGNVALWSRYTAEDSGYHYLVRFIGNHDSETEVYSYNKIIMNRDAVRNFMLKIASLPDYNEVVSTGVLAIEWYPFSFSDYFPFAGSENFSFSVAKYDITLQDGRAGYYPDNANYRIITQEWQATPQLLDSRRSRNLPPHYGIEMIFQPFGVIPIDYSMFIDSGLITIGVDIDVETNNSVLYYKLQDLAGLPAKQVIGSTALGGELSYNVSVSTSFKTGMSLLHDSISVLSDISGFQLFDPKHSTPMESIEGAVHTSLNMIETYMGGFRPNLTASMASGTFLTDIFPRLIYTRNSCNVANDKLGQPLNEEVQLSTLSGFCKCVGVSLPLTCTAAEHSRIIAFMEGGFFLE